MHSIADIRSTIIEIRCKSHSKAHCITDCSLLIFNLFITFDATRSYGSNDRHVSGSHSQDLSLFGSQPGLLLCIMLIITIASTKTTIGTMTPANTFDPANDNPKIAPGSIKNRTNKEAIANHLYSAVVLPSAFASLMGIRRRYGIGYHMIIPLMLKNK